MRFRKVLLMGSVSAFAMSCSVMSASAQNAPEPVAAPPQIISAPEEVVVTGIRASLDKSMAVKKESDSIVEVVSAEDIGKMPDKNVGDALSRIPGVNTATSVTGGSGGFGENDRVSLRGTTPSLTFITINGHSVGTGDWFILDELTGAGRSVSTSLLPSEIVSKMVVFKNQEADLPEGGSAGYVDIQTRKPLDLKQPFTAQIMTGGSLQSLDGSLSPQFNALIGWRNDTKTLGVIVQPFYEKVDIRRDGYEVLGYDAVGAGDALANPNMKNAAGQTGCVCNIGVLVPDRINNPEFLQTRTREGGVMDVQYRPMSNLTVDVNAFYSYDDYSNVNYSFFLAPGKNPAVMPTSYTVSNGVLTQASYAGYANPTVATAAGDNGNFWSETLPRVGNYSSSDYVESTVNYAPNNRLTFDGSIGASHGVGKTPMSGGAQYRILGYGSDSYTLNGISTPATQSIQSGYTTSAGLANPNDWAWGWTDLRDATETDDEYWAKADGDYYLGEGVLDSIKAGIRVTSHARVVVTAQALVNNGVGQPVTATTSLPNGPNGPSYGGATFPSNFGSGLGGGSLLGFNLNPGVLNAWANANTVATAFNEDAGDEVDVHERNEAGYVMTRLKGADWSGNAGVRIVSSQENVQQNVESGTGPFYSDAFPGAGGYAKVDTLSDYLDILPSANLSFNPSKDVYVKAGIARTMTRPDFFQTSGAQIATTEPVLGQIGYATGGNPKLKPIRAWTEDLETSWYFAPQSMVSAGIFHTNYLSAVDQGPISLISMVNNQLSTPGHPVVSQYYLSTYENLPAESKGFELAYQQNLFHGFGLTSNYTYALSKESNGNPMPGGSRNSYNTGGFYEDKLVSARVTYSWRDHFLDTIDRGTQYNTAAAGSLDGTVVVTINSHFSLEFDALHLTDELERDYANNTTQVRAIYDNGRTFYLSARYKY